MAARLERRIGPPSTLVGSLWGGTGVRERHARHGPHRYNDEHNPDPGRRIRPQHAYPRLIQTAKITARTRLYGHENELNRDLWPL